MHDPRRLAPARRLGLVAAAMLIVAGLAAPSAALGADGDIQLIRRFPSFLFAPATQVRNAGDGTGRLFVVEQRGTIRAISGSGSLQSGYFLDIRSKVEAGGERGLLGVAFHPDFETNRRLFAIYTRDGGDIVVSRFTANSAGTRVSASTARPIMLIEHSAASNHNGGGIAFGPDGNLYIAIGDGGGSGDPERDARSITRNLLGKVLRVNVNSAGSGPFDRYGIPTSNPYRGSQTGLDEIWAYGLRNPWRLSFDRGTGDLYIADVGQGRREEVNRQPAGAPGGRDYGWNVMEGNLCYDESRCPLAGDTLPVAWYSHANGNCSITGGYVYRGTAYPKLAGQYVFADYCSGRIWTLPPGGGTADLRQRADTLQRITSFGESESGELFAVTSAGKLWRVTAP